MLRAALHDFRGLEGDDGVTLALLPVPAPELITGLLRQQLDVHPPLHFLALKYWVALAGDSLLSLRFFNILMDLVTAAFLIRLSRRMSGPLAGLIAAGLWLVSPLMIFGLELVRMYTLLGLLVTVGWTLLLESRCSQSTRRHLLFYAGALLCGLLATYTHLFGGLVLVMAGLLLFDLRSVGPVRLLSKLAMLGLAGILLLPFLLPAVQRYRSGSSLGASINLVDFRSFLEVPPLIIGTLLVGRVPWAAMAGLVLVAGLLLLSIWLYRRRPLVRPLLFTFWFVIFVLSALAYYVDLYKPRYLIAFVPLLLILLAAVADLAGRRWRWLLTVILAGAMIWGLRLELDHSRKDDWQMAARFIEAHERPGDVVIIVPDWGRKVFSYHYEGQASVLGLFASVAPELVIEPALAHWTDGAERVWFVHYQVEVSDPARRVDAWFRQQAALATEVFPAGMHLRLYDFTPRMESLPVDVMPLDGVFGDVIRLRGVHLPVNHGPAGDLRLHPPSNWVHLTLYWQLDEPVPDFQPVIQLTDGLGQVWGAALDRADETLERFPPSAWEPGELWRTDFDINLNPSTPPGLYNILVQARAVPDGDWLPASGTGGGLTWLLAGQFRIE